MRDANGAIQHDFKGKLSFFWPKYDDQFTLNRYDDNYDPLFPYGYGLTYESEQHIGLLNEEKRLANNPSESNSVPLFVRNLAKGWYWGFAEANNALTPISGPSGTSADKQSVTMQSVNLAYQEDGRRFVWHKANSSVAAILAREEPLESLTNGEARFLQAKVRFSDNLSEPVMSKLVERLRLFWFCQFCGWSIYALLTELLIKLPSDEPWQIHVPHLLLDVSSGFLITMGLHRFYKRAKRFDKYTVAAHVILIIVAALVWTQFQWYALQALYGGT